MNTIALPETLDTQHAIAIQTALCRQLDDTPHADSNYYTLDASGVRHFDSAGLALLLACRRHAQAQGRQLHVQAWPPGLLALAKVYGVFELLDSKSLMATYPNA